MRIRCAILSLSAAIGLAVPAGAQTFVQYNFNSTPPDASTATGVAVPSTGTGLLMPIGGVTVAYAAGSNGDTASPTDNSGLNLSSFPAQGTGSGTAGLSVATSTVAPTTPGAFLTISLDLRQSGTASRFFQLQVSSDGVNFANAAGGTASIAGPIPAPNTGTTFTNAGLYSNDTGIGTIPFVQNIRYAFPEGSVYENNANFAFRWVSVFDPATGTGYVSSDTGTTAAYSGGGTARFDLVTVAYGPVPEPASVLGAAVFALGAVRAIRRRSAGR